MTYSVRGLLAKPYMHFYGLSDEDLANFGAKRLPVDVCPGFPDRIEMREIAVGAHVLLLNQVSMALNTPYRAAHAIFIREGAVNAYEERNEVPAVMFDRLLSLRAFDEKGMMVDAVLAKGDEIESTILRFFANPDVKNIHAHNAKRRCFSGEVIRPKAG
ncbi:MAG: hypothetical protein COA84_09395 [Robiginitomaculum sp.]|nr:MAG: hypothetical protein COA84_09395 [Robiginitomaculum sp.]